MLLLLFVVAFEEEKKDEKKREKRRGDRDGVTQPSTATLLLDACDFVLSSGKPATLGGDRICWSGPEVVPLASGCEWSKPLAGWGPVLAFLPTCC